MDGKGCWRDHIVAERPRRSLTYEEVYVHAADSVSAATAGIGRYVTLYNSRRPQASLADRTPADASVFSTALPAAA